MRVRKEEIIEWKDKCLIFSEKVELYELTKLHKPCFKTYDIDMLLNDKGYYVLRLSPYQSDLNPK